MAKFMVWDYNWCYQGVYQGDSETEVMARLNTTKKILAPIVQEVESFIEQHSPNKPLSAIRIATKQSPFFYYDN